ncbi:hypothetical protein [Humidesulfovibrio idahonensis]
MSGKMKEHRYKSQHYPSNIERMVRDSEAVQPRISAEPITPDEENVKREQLKNYKEEILLKCQNCGKKLPDLASQLDALGEQRGEKTCRVCQKWFRFDLRKWPMIKLEKLTLR